MLKAIFFDAAGTLIHLPRGVGWHYADVLKRHGLALNEEELADAFRTVWKEMPARPVTKRPRPDDDRGWWSELVSRMLDRLGAELPGRVFDTLFADLYNRFALPGVWTLYPDAVGTLDALRGRFRLGVISNFDGRLRTVLNDLGVLDCFETLVISSEVGADKPDPFIFDESLRRLGVSPHEAVHVGDDPVHDWQGAASCGMNCFALDRGKNSLDDLLRWLDTPALH